MKKSAFLISGKHAVTEALKNPKRNVLKIFLTEDSKKSLNKDKCVIATGGGVILSEVNRSILKKKVFSNFLPGTINHMKKCHQVKIF